MTTATEEISFFRENLTNFEEALEIALQVSAAVGNKPSHPSIAWGTWIFTRMCILAGTLHNIVQPARASDTEYLLDHISAGILSRSLIEASLMLHYLADEVSDQEWECKRLVLNLHDCTSRIRLFKGLKHTAERDRLSIERDSLQTVLKANPHFSNLREEQRKSVLGGQAQYIGGIRKIAKNIGWDVQHFDAIYNYLSSQAHSSPMSFFRMDEGRINFETPSAYQIYFSAVSLDYATHSLVQSSLRTLSLVPEISGLISSERIEEFKLYLSCHIVTRVRDLASDVLWPMNPKVGGRP